MARFTFVFSMLAAVLAIGDGSSRAGMLVASRNTDEILSYDETTGAFLGVFASGGQLSQPFNMTVGPDGMLYVANIGRHAGIPGSVLRYDTSTGAFVDNFVTTATASAIFGPDGDLYVIGFRSIDVYDGADGAFIRTFATLYADSEHAIFGPDRNLYVAVWGGDEVLKFDGVTGAPLGVFASGDGLDGPVTLAFGPDGNLYVGSYYSSSVLRYDGQTGAFIDVFASGDGLAGPYGLVFRPDGYLYVSSFDTDKILRYDGTTGAFIDEFASGVGDGPVGMVFTSAQAVPEPASLTLFGLGALGLAVARKRWSRCEERQIR